MPFSAQRCSPRECVQPSNPRFEAGTDSLSFGIGITAADVAVGANGSNATLSIFDLELATFSGVSQANLQGVVDSTLG